MPPESLATHLQGLLGLSRTSQAPIESTYPDLLNSWRATGLPVTIDGDSEDNGNDHVDDGDASFELELPPGIPLPTLLDYYTPPADAARLDEGVGGIGGGGRGVRFAEMDDDFSGPDGPARSLTARLKNQCNSESTFKKLLDLLSSTLPSPSLQDPLMSLFSYDPSSFDLISEIFSTPTMRQQILAQARGGDPGALRATADEFVPPAEALNGVVNPVIGGLGLGSREEAEERINQQLEENANRPLWTGESNVPEAIQYPYVFTSQTASAVTSYGGRLALPLGHMTRKTEFAEEVIIPPANPIPPRSTERLIQVKELGPLAAGCFPGYQCLNRIQSIIQPTAMGSNENMLVCAPTGAGKTDVAVMTILRVLGQHLREPVRLPFGQDSIRKDDFKVIYVAPMKALAAEITRKVGKRLAWLGIQVRELTGDMQLSRKEINETQIIVTTPEKWDVVTRKPTGEGELASKVKLLIIDEVHLLNEERGAVIETIVARTLRLVESSQTLIRIVGLSATLPNYIDVSDFLRVNRYQGLFFFDSSFRPVPLEQNFIGVIGKVRSEKSKKNMDQVVFDKVAENINAGHQVMVFVHARKDTVKTAEKLKEMAQMEGDTANFDPRTHPQFDFFRREIGMSRNKEMKQLFDYGFGIHHAGMLRSDRNMMERMFEANCIKVLVCTATLAWGVNLPAHAVVIKGTQVYDAGKGNFVDLSILDVLQIFGRAGRPGYETSGVGYICTTQDKLDHYLHAVLAQHPIESKSAIPSENL